MEIGPNASLSFYKSRILDYPVIILTTKAEFCKVWNLYFRPTIETAKHIQLKFSRSNIAFCNDGTVEDETLYNFKISRIKTFNLSHNYLAVTRRVTPRESHLVSAVINDILLLNIKYKMGLRHKQ